MRILKLAIFFSLIFSISAKEIVLKVLTEDLRPYNYEENGEIRGISTDLVKNILKKSGYKYTLELYPWARAYKTAMTEENVLIYSMIRTESRKKLFNWIGTISQKRFYFYKLKKRTDIKINKLEDALNYQIGCLYEDFGHQYLKNKGFPNLEVVYKRDTNFHKLLRGRIDLLPYDELSFRYNLIKLKLDPKLFSKAFMISDLNEAFYLAASKKTDKEVIYRLRELLKEIKPEFLK